MKPQIFTNFDMYNRCTTVATPYTHWPYHIHNLQEPEFIYYPISGELKQTTPA